MNRNAKLLTAAGLTLLAGATSTAEAQPGRLNLRLEAGLGVPTAGYLAPRGRYDRSANFGLSGFLSIDYVITGPLAIEAIGAIGGLFEMADDPVRGAGASLTAFGGVGARLRFLDARNLWINAHVGIAKFDGVQFGGDAAIGYDFGLTDETDLGLFLRYQLMARGDGPADDPTDTHFDSIIYAGMGVTFGLLQDEPEGPPPPPPPPADTDLDDDGIEDALDLCPSEPEDRDSFEDSNGCPDPDNDADGVPDTTDGAPLEPEDRDDFEDEDGVPDPDNDRDGILDGADRCPLVQGLEVDGGCPPSDRDSDTVIDREDNCPDEPGTVENHGCVAVQQVILRADAIEITDSVYFRTNRDVIERRSFPLLDNVAAVIMAHPEITMVHVEGHTDSRGNHDRNVTLSQKRAEAVVAYLVRRGVDASRLQAHGYGPDRPVVPNASTPDDHARNRRVEFRIQGADIPSRDSRPE